MKHPALFGALSLLSLALTSSYTLAQDADTNSNLNTRKAAPVAESRSFFDLFKDDKVEKNTAPAPSPVAEPEPAAKTSQALPAVNPTASADESKVSLTNEQRELMRVQHYLNSLSTIISDFTQIAPDGALTMGKFYLKRPGKIRWEYAPPTPILIIANGKSLVYYDKELEQVSHLPIDSTLAGFLAREKIDLNDPELKVNSLTTAPGVLRITLSQRKKPEEGSLMLEFSDQPLQIRNMVITDAQKQVTTVSLSKARFGVPLDNYLFIWQDPRKKK